MICVSLVQPHARPGLRKSAASAQQPEQLAPEQLPLRSPLAPTHLPCCRRRGRALSRRQASSRRCWAPPHGRQLPPLPQQALQQRLPRLAAATVWVHPRLRWTTPGLPLKTQPLLPVRQLQPTRRRRRAHPQHLPPSMPWRRSMRSRRRRQLQPLRLLAASLGRRRRRRTAASSRWRCVLLWLG